MGLKRFWLNMSDLLMSLALTSVFAALPIFAFAQSTTNGPTITPAATTDAISSSTFIAAPTTTASPYKIEQLVDDNRKFNDFVVGPGKFEISLKPGESKTVEITVSNRMGIPEEFKIDVEDMAGGSSPDQPVVLLGNDHGAYTLKDYVSVPANRFLLQNMQRARIPVTVSLPPDAEPGGRYGSLLVSVASHKAGDDSVDSAAPTSAVVSRIGTLFFVTTPGEVKTDGSMTNFDTLTHKHVFFSGPIDFSVLFENRGAIHLEPYGTLTIKNMFGESVGSVELDPWFILPQSVRTREISWNRAFLFGRYVATAEVNRGYGDQTDVQSVVFWVIPWKLVLTVFAGLVVFFLLLKLFFSQFEFKRK